MKHWKLLSLVVAVIFLAGCLAPKINFTIKPDPITIRFQQSELTGITLQFKMSGLSFSYTLESAVIEVRDGAGEVVYEHTESIGESIWVVGGVADDYELPSISLLPLWKEIEQSLGFALTEEVYNSELKGQEYELKMILAGKNPTEDTAVVRFE